MSCSRLFWISWDAQGVSVGKGNSVGEEEMLTMKDPQPFENNTIGVHAGVAGKVTWEIVSTEKGRKAMIVSGL